MTLFDRMTLLLRDIFKGLFGAHQQDPQQLAERVISEQRRSQRRLADSLTDLIFQRKKFESRMAQLENRKLSMQQDLELAATQDRDDLAIHLMEELDLVASELIETANNLQMVADEIETARQVEVELAQQIKKSEAQLAVLVSRSQSVKMREDLQSQFAKIHREINHMQPGLTGIDESILKLESKLENMQGSKHDWKKELHKMRKERTDHFRKSKLIELKSRIKGRALPGQSIIPEVITTH